jgi:hypothetical protein
MNPEQIGFKRGARTSDHIFTLKSHIDIFFKNNKYLFACFVDLKKAFDTVKELFQCSFTKKKKGIHVFVLVEISLTV